MVDISTNEASF